MNKNQKGFTLVELLVVIAIIAVLTGALLLAINPQAMIQKGRDAQRLQDLDTLSSAINLALADGEITLTDTSSCSDCTSASGDRDLDGAGWVKYTIVTGKTGLTKFLPTLPQDPLNTTPNVYTYGSDGTDFEIDAVLEHADYDTKESTDGGNDTTVYEVGTSLTVL